MKATMFIEGRVITGTGQIITAAEGAVDVDPTDPETARALLDGRLIENKKAKES